MNDEQSGEQHLTDPETNAKVHGEISPVDKKRGKPNTGRRVEKPLRAYAQRGISQIEKLLKNTSYQLPKGPEGEENLPDRPALIDQLHTDNFDNAVAEIIRQTGDNSQIASFDQLSSILNAELKDRVEQEESFERVKMAFNVAKNYLMNPDNPRRVNVSLTKNEDGKWEAEPQAKPGSIYYTFTGSRLVELRSIIKQFKYEHGGEISLLNNSFIAALRIKDGEQVDFQQQDAHSLLKYIVSKKEKYRDRDNFFRYYDLFDTFEIKLRLYCDASEKNRAL